VVLGDTVVVVVVVEVVVGHGSPLGRGTHTKVNLSLSLGFLVASVTRPFPGLVPRFAMGTTKS
jgi:hypothetical protein